jgi:hypothetical protein
VRERKNDDPEVVCSYHGKLPSEPGQDPLAGIHGSRFRCIFSSGPASASKNQGTTQGAAAPRDDFSISPTSVVLPPFSVGRWVPSLVYGWIQICDRDSGVNVSRSSCGC